jgi:hypothetical protein
MKKLTIIILMLSMSACTSSNKYGKCVGLNGNEDPKLQYEYSASNIAMGILFFSLIAPPIYVALDQLKCPVGTK